MATMIDSVLKQVVDREIKFVQLWFTDLLGSLKSIEIPSSELQHALEEGIGFDGSSIHGFARIDESDMLAIPDLSTFVVMPWDNVGRLICDVQLPGGAPYEGDPRYVLRRALDRAASSHGLEMVVGTELEYFYFSSNQQPTGVDVAGYFDLSPQDSASEIRRDTVTAIKDIGISVNAAHHEVAPSQQEIDLRHATALRSADALMTCRYAVKQIAIKNGVYASFMPKPLSNENGSGLHVHQSLITADGGNAFFDPDDTLHLSAIARKYLAGLLHYAPEIIGICAQWVNSFKRLVPGFEAPVYVTWASRNRSNMIRIPMYEAGKEGATRIEFRAPDPACNPYLAFAVMLHAGLDGMDQDMTLCDPVERDVYGMSSQERKGAGITMLPGSLNEAITAMEDSQLVRNALGDHIFDKFIENKRIEWDSYRAHVHEYELERYLPVL
ncbi:glutamine synthetase [Candidatus Bipolaricaulota bacterium]|nr:glutamine synthetase [Candidatus Bipolaricaulota bacterium]